MRCRKHEHQPGQNYAFQSALLHTSIPNTSKLLTLMIGSYDSWCIPPRIISSTGLQRPSFLDSFGPISLLYKAVSARNLDILHQS